MVSEFRLELPLPAEALHPNAHIRSWQQRHRLVQKARGEAEFVARQDWRGPPLASADVQATFYMPRRRDGDNLNAWLKFYLDGLADAGIVVNDSAFRLLPPEQVTGNAAKGERKVVLTIRPTA